MWLTPDTPGANRFNDDPRINMSLMIALAILQ
jgi:hypothetical protein